MVSEIFVLTCRNGPHEGVRVHPRVWFWGRKAGLVLCILAAAAAAAAAARQSLAHGRERLTGTLTKVSEMNRCSFQCSTMLPGKCPPHCTHISVRHASPRYGSPVRVAVCIYSSPIFIPGPQPPAPPFLHTWMAVTPGKMTSVAPRMSFRWSSLSSRLNHSASAACTYTGQLKIEAQVRCVE